MAGKGYKGKTCAYCGVQGISSTADHVIARAFFLHEDRANLPQVPACEACNGKKAALETYVSAVLPIASRHEEGDRFRRDFVSPRIGKNRKLQQDLRLDQPPKLVNINGVLQPMHEVHIDAGKITDLMVMILQGLYFHHFGRPLSAEFYADIQMVHPDGQNELAIALAPVFQGAERFEVNLGRGSFEYWGMRSALNEDITLWNFSWHNGIALYGNDGVGTNHWWGVTRPTAEVAARARARAKG